MKYGLYQADFLKKFKDGLPFSKLFTKEADHEHKEST